MGTVLSMEQYMNSDFNHCSEAHHCVARPLTVYRKSLYRFAARNFSTDKPVILYHCSTVHYCARKFLNIKMYSLRGKKWRTTSLTLLG